MWTRNGGICVLSSYRYNSRNKMIKTQNGYKYKTHCLVRGTGTKIKSIVFFVGMQAWRRDFTSHYGKMGESLAPEIPVSDR